MQEQYSLLKYYNSKLTEKQQRNFLFDELERLMNKLEPFNDSEFEGKINQVFKELKIILEDSKTKKKSYYKEFNELKSLVKEKYGFVPKGSVQGQYMGLGIAIGTGIGAGFISINPAFIGVGIPFGIVIGSAIGASKEKELNEQGKLY